LERGKREHDQAPREDPSIFDLYISLIFFGKVPIEEHYGTQLDNEALIQQGGEEYRKLLNLYLLCDRLQDRMAKNRLIDAVAAQSFILYNFTPPAGDAAADTGAADGDDNSDVDFPMPVQGIPAVLIQKRDIRKHACIEQDA
jgi:hypothetical protein